MADVVPTDSPTGGPVDAAVAPADFQGSDVVKMEREPNMSEREIELPTGPLGVAFVKGSTTIASVRDTSTVVGILTAGDKVVAFAPPGGERVATAQMTDSELVKYLTEHKDQPGRRVYVVAGGMAEG